jgi:hypothetical protein
MAGIDGEVNRFQDTHPEDILVVGDSAASSASKDKRRKGVLAAKSRGSLAVNAGPPYARNYVHTQHPGGPMAPPSTSDLGHHQDFNDPIQARNLSQIVSSCFKTRCMDTDLPAGTREWSDAYNSFRIRA